MTEQQIFIYLSSVLVIGLMVVLVFKAWITRISKKRQTRIKNIEDFDAIKVESDDLVTLEETQDRALKSVKKRYTIINRISFGTVGVLVFLALLFPFLDALPTTIISIFIAATGVVIGIAAKPIIENAFSGLVISVSKVIRIGDTVILNGNYGNVEDITLTHTTIKIWNWRRYIVPNNKMLTQEITNLNSDDNYLWAYVEFHVSFEADIEQVRELALEAARHSDYNNQEEDPSFWVMELMENSVRCWAAAWTDSPSNAWELSNDIRTNLIIAFQKHGIKSHQWNLVGLESGTFPSIDSKNSFQRPPLKE